MKYKKLLDIIKSASFWKNVAASIVATIIFVLIGLIGGFIKSLITNTDISSAVEDVLKALFTKLPIPLILIIFIIILLILVVSNLILNFDRIGSLLKTQFFKKKDKQSGALEETNLHDTVLFNYRMSSAFPGVRNLEWFTDSKIALGRLSIVLKSPLKFNNLNREFTSQPIWIYRGYSAFPIEEFEIIDKRKAKCRIMFDEILIDKIAIYHGDSYYRDFIYIETKPDKPTGLYYKNLEEIKECIERIGYCREEFAISKNRFVSREDYDDGATIIKGKPVELVEPKLRTRYLSRYNFIIAPHNSPINNRDFDYYSNNLYNEILQGKFSFTDLFKTIIKLPKKPY